MGAGLITLVGRPPLPAGTVCPAWERSVGPKLVLGLLSQPRRGCEIAPPRTLPVVCLKRRHFRWCPWPARDRVDVRMRNPVAHHGHVDPLSTEHVQRTAKTRNPLADLR